MIAVVSFKRWHSALRRGGLERRETMFGPAFLQIMTVGSLGYALAFGVASATPVPVMHTAEANLLPASFVAGFRPTDVIATVDTAAVRLLNRHGLPIAPTEATVLLIYNNDELKARINPTTHTRINDTSD